MKIAHPMGPIAPECSGCNRVSPLPSGDGEFCLAYGLPAAWFRNGNRCPLGTHYPRAEVAKKAFINPLKLSKMKKKGLA